MAKILARPSDVIAANGQPQVVFGGTGNDTIQAANGASVVVGGPGNDTIATGTGNDTVVIFDLCEVADGETIDMGTGYDRVIAPVSREELENLGVELDNVDDVIVRSQSCRSECANVPTCSGHGACIEGAHPGEMACACDEPWAGVNCETTHVDPQVVWEQHHATPADSLGDGHANADGKLLLARKASVVAFSTTGQETSVVNASDAFFAISPSASYVGVDHDGSYEVYGKNGQLVYQAAAQDIAFGKFVPGSARVLLPEVHRAGDFSEITHARFYDSSGLVARFEIPDVQSMELAPNKFIYSTRTQLIATSHTGTTLWQVPLVLKRFEVSQSGTHLVGQLEENEGIVHVDLANGSLRADGNGLGAALWNLSLSPSGRFSVATTRDTVFIFDNGIRLRDVKVPAKWLVSAAISDVGDVVVGAQDASHEGRIYLIGANGQGIAAVARPEEFDGYRPKVGFFPNGQQFYSNESNNLAVFSLR